MVVYSAQKISRLGGFLIAGLRRGAMSSGSDGTCHVWPWRNNSRNFINRRLFGQFRVGVKSGGRWGVWGEGGRLEGRMNYQT